MASSAVNLLRPPVHQAMRTLDRSAFSRAVPISAARIADNKNISRIRRDLIKSKDALDLREVSPVQLDPEKSRASANGKCMLLRPEIRHDDTSTWTSTVRKYVDLEEIGVIPYTLNLDYNHWTYHDIMSSILPDHDQDELPSGFTAVGHVAHLNLREQYLPYKELIATVLMDKNARIKTVINKTDDVGQTSAYRTFNYELLAGDPDLNVTVQEGGCTFHFDYSKVYWNSRLETEHRRLIEKFQPGEAVCDVMAGVGPFAIPAGKKKVFVWANDLNPDSFNSLQDCIRRNKVGAQVRAFNQDGRSFIRESAQLLLKVSEDQPPSPSIAIQPPHDNNNSSRNHNNQNRDSTTNGQRRPTRGHRNLATTAAATKPSFRLPKTFSHYVMNLPDSATTFLDAFIGVYRGHERLFEPYTSVRLPMVHVHCFSTKSDDNAAERVKICREISGRIGVEITQDTPELTIFDVRDVAPKKRMFCASFRLPAEVAFR
ncbi:MAG: hypothetical protein M1825_006028 [Sarcosagium campestre]|nr:MAG: hypothetical protein M1825_006028 [Sarcosagium campestre]